MLWLRCCLCFSVDSSSYDSMVCCAAQHNSTLNASTLWSALANFSSSHYTKHFNAIALGCLSNYTDVSSWVLHTKWAIWAVLTGSWILSIILRDSLSLSHQKQSEWFSHYILTPGVEHRERLCRFCVPFNLMDSLVFDWVNWERKGIKLGKCEHQIKYCRGWWIMVLTIYNLVG